MSQKEMICEMHPKAKVFGSGIDYSTHMLFEHGISSNPSPEVNDKIKERLQKKYNDTNNRLTVLSRESNLLGAKYSASDRDKDIWKEYQKYSDMWQTQVYRMNQIIKEIESYGLSEDDFR